MATRFVLGANDMQKTSMALWLAAFICSATAVAHMACIFLGPACYRAQMAPQALVASSHNGTLLAPLATLLVSAVFIGFALFALSGAGVIKPLLKSRFVLLLIGALCALRGLATLPLSLLFPEQVSVFSLVAGGVWLLTGALFLFGRRRCRVNR